MFIDDAIFYKKKIWSQIKVGQPRNREKLKRMETRSVFLAKVVMTIMARKRNFFYQEVDEDAEEI